MEKFHSEGSVFNNFRDDRKNKFEAHAENIRQSVSKIPAGERVTIVLSRNQLGKIRIPLDLMAAEMIS